MPPHQARASLGLYLGLVVLASGGLQGWMMVDGRPIREFPFYVPLTLMWIPGLAAIATRVVRREGFADMGLRLGGWRGVRWIAGLWFLPTAIGGVAYGVAWTTGLTGFEPDITTFAMRWAINVFVGGAITLVAATGEELGWRGTMVHRLADAGVPYPVVTSGVIWGVWHMPLIVSGQYAVGPIPWLSTLLFVLATVSASIVMTRAVWTTGSVWAACAFHAAWNATIQSVFDRSTAEGPNTFLWVGESGILLVAVELLVAFLFVRGVWLMRRHPRDPATAGRFPG
jgi:membrane protease YdiL (CAAX protease family)